MTLYSFKDLVGSFSHPLAGAYIFAGELGIGQLTINMNTERTVHDIAADGAVMVSAIPGDNGTIGIEIQQTAALQQFLVGWTNMLYAAQKLGDVSTWASAVMSFRNIVDQSVHVVTGVSPSKFPEKTYATQGGKITWSLMAAAIYNL